MPPTTSNSNISREEGNDEDFYIIEYPANLMTQKEEIKCVNRECYSTEVHAQGMCKRCYGTIQSRRIRDYKTQADAEFLAKCEIASKKRRVSAQPKTYVEEFVQLNDHSNMPTTSKPVKPKKRSRRCVGCRDEWTEENKHDESMKLCILCFQQIDYRVCQTCLEWTSHFDQGKCQHCFLLTQMDTNLNDSIENLTVIHDQNESVIEIEENNDDDDIIEILEPNKINENDDEDIQVIDFIPNTLTKLAILKQLWEQADTNNAPQRRVNPIT